MELRDAGELRRRLGGWLRHQVEGAGLRGVIFGLSGGVDSAVVCGLAAEVLGPERCLGIIMPAESIDEDARLAEAVAQAFDVPTLTIDLSKPFRELHTLLDGHVSAARRAARGLGEQPDTSAAARAGEAAEVAEAGDAARVRLADANLKPRLRMVTLYYYANLLDYMVLGTGNRAEFTLGYFTKWGDGAADAFPLADLLKHEVWDLARELGVPDAVVDRAPSAGLWSGQTDEEELGLRYEQVDRYLSEGTSGDAGVDAEIERRYRASRHKVGSPPTPGLS